MAKPLFRVTSLVSPPTAWLFGIMGTGKVDHYEYLVNIKFATEVGIYWQLWRLPGTYRAYLGTTQFRYYSIPRPISTPRYLVCLAVNGA